MLKKKKETQSQAAKAVIILFTLSAESAQIAAKVSKAASTF